MIVEGTALVIPGDDVDTDVMYPGAYLNIEDPEQMKPFLFEGYDPSLRDRLGPETIAIYTQRPATNRGNSYPGGTQLQGPLHAKYNIMPSVDCANTGIGEFNRPEHPTTDAPNDPENSPPNGPSNDPRIGKGPSCWVQPLPGAAGPNSIPHISFKDYLKATPPTK